MAITSIQKARFPVAVCRLALAAAPLLVGAGMIAAAATDTLVRVSPRNPRYFELSDGRPYLPIGLNLIAPDGARGSGESNGLARMEEWMQKLAAQGGNYARVWLSSPFWDVEAERSGVYDEAKARRIDALLAMAQRHGIRVKLTLEHFREMSATPRQRWANKPLHLVSNGGTATNMADFFTGAASRERFKQKLAWYAQRYRTNTAIFGWELWNEVNAVAAGEKDYLPWTEVMLTELYRAFPHHLALQSLGSYDTARVRDLYCRHSRLPRNDAAQVHRYLDLGASLEVCHGPVDVLAADAIREIRACDPGRPILLAESGAVEPRHTGPFKLYAKDKDGIILHDVLFAPFFAGAAGAGQIWHWDAYVDRNNLWHHFGRFAAAVKGLDPAVEEFQPMLIRHPRLRVYILWGHQTALIWCRDAQSTWQTELERDQPPAAVTGAKIDLSSLLDPNESVRAEAYDPWSNKWGDAAVQATTLVLPEFKRSLVVKLVFE